MIHLYLAISSVLKSKLIGGCLCKSPICLLFSAAESMHMPTTQSSIAKANKHDLICLDLNSVVVFVVIML